MSEETVTKAKPVVIPADLHQSLKVRAASEGKKLNKLVADKLAELVPDPVPLHPVSTQPS